MEDFGIAATFALSYSFIEISSQLALDKLLVQHKDGESDEILHNAHFVSVIRGFVLAILLFLTAWPIAYLFKLQEITWAFQLLALAPIFRGFVHLDYAVLQRKMVLTPTIWFEVLPQILATVLLLPLLFVFPDFRAMLVIVIAIPLFAVVASHIQAKRPFHLHFDKSIILQMFHFSWPLMISGLLMFFVFQGDRLLVGGGYGVEILGYYSAAFSLLMLPTLIFQRVLNTISLPLLSSAKTEPHAYNAIIRRLIPINFGIAAFLGVVYLTIGVWGFDFVYGEKFRPAIPILYWLACMQALRAVRSVPSIIAMSHANTKNDMYSNLARSVALLLGLAATYFEADVIWIAIAGVIGELIAVCVSFFLIRSIIAAAISIAKVAVYYIALIGILAVSMVAVHHIGIQTSFWIQLSNFTVGMLALLVVGSIFFLIQKTTSTKKQL